MKNLRYVLICLLVLLTGGTVAAETTISFIPAETQPTATQTEVSKDGITLTVSAGTMNRDDNYRTNKNQTLTITSTIGKITKVTFTSPVADPDENYGAGYSEWNTGSFTAEGAEGTWTGEADKVVLTAGNHQVRAIVYNVTVDGEGGTPENPSQEKVLYTENFTTSQGKFTIEDKVMPEGLTFVWSQDSRYGMKASAYVSGTDLAAESWLVSPVIDLTKASATSISFSHALNFFADVERAKTEATVWVKVNGSEWTLLEGVTYPETLSWTFIDSQIETPLCDGKKVQFAFKYLSTEEKAGTWEVKSFTLKGQGEATVEGDQKPEEEVKTITTAEALALIAELADGKISAENYIVTGIVVSIDEISTSYGNATFNMADNADDGEDKQIKVFRAKGLTNEKIEDENIIKVGDQLTVFGRLQRYVRDGVMTPEMTSCYINTINGSPSGIEDISTLSSSTPLYNLRGQRVDENYRGIVLKNGKKVFVK